MKGCDTVQNIPCMDFFQCKIFLKVLNSLTNLILLTEKEENIYFLKYLMQFFKISN